MQRTNLFVPALAVLMLLIISGIAVAQDNTVIDAILAEKELTYQHASYLLLSADGTPPADGEMGSAYPPEKTLTLGEYSLLVMETFDISGGLMYTVTGMPRYAARELAFRDIVQGRAYPRMKLSGERALRIVGRVLTLQEEGRLR